MKRLLIKLLALVPVAVVMVAVNLWVDPAGLFHSEYEGALAGHLLAGRNVTGIVNYDERQVQRLYIEGLSAAPERVVLGSSRTLLLQNSWAPEHTFFNSSVSGATLEDLLAIYWLYHRHGLIPRQVIVGLDPWMLNAHNEQVRFVSLLQEYEEAMASATGEKTSFLQSIGQRIRGFREWEVLSPSYFQSSLKMLLSGRRTKTVETTALDEGESVVKRADGSLRFGAEERSRTVAEVAQMARGAAVSRRVYSLGDFRELDPDGMVKLQALTTLLQRDGVRIVFFLPPYHPETYRVLTQSPRYRIIQDAERFFREFAASNAIPVYGSYDPAVLTLSGRDFYDSLHAKPAVFESVLDKR